MASLTDGRTIPSTCQAKVGAGMLRHGVAPESRARISMAPRQRTVERWNAPEHQPKGDFPHETSDARSARAGVRAGSGLREEIRTGLDHQQRQSAGDESGGAAAGQHDADQSV